MRPGRATAKSVSLCPRGRRPSPGSRSAGIGTAERALAGIAPRISWAGRGLPHSVGQQILTEASQGLPVQGKLLERILLHLRPPYSGNNQRDLSPVLRSLSSSTTCSVYPLFRDFVEANALGPAIPQRGRHSNRSDNESTYPRQSPYHYTHLVIALPKRCQPNILAQDCLPEALGIQESGPPQKITRLSRSFDMHAK